MDVPDALHRPFYRNGWDGDISVGTGSVPKLYILNGLVLSGSIK